MKNIHITIAYDGSAFVGFQRQANGLAVQEVIENALARILGTPTTLYFVARTDSGVHAWAQECTFFSAKDIPGERFRNALNALLPPSIRVRASREVPMDYSVRRANTGKTYIYQIQRGKEDHPFLYRYVWRPGYALDLEKMIEAADVLVGTHDFTAFRGNNSVPADPVRTIYNIHIWEREDIIRVAVTGDGFLYHMVRNIAGALVDVGRGRKTTAELQEILLGKDRCRLGMTAPAPGLCLLHVYFEPIMESSIQQVLARRVAIWNEK